MEIFDCTELQFKAVPRFSEFCYCCCVPLLPQLACSILATWERPYSEALYTVEEIEPFSKHNVATIWRSSLIEQVSAKISCSIDLGSDHATCNVPGILC